MVCRYLETGVGQSLLLFGSVVFWVCVTLLSELGYTSNHVSLAIESCPDWWIGSSVVFGSSFFFFFGGNWILVLLFLFMIMQMELAGMISWITQPCRIQDYPVQDPSPRCNRAGRWTIKKQPFTCRYATSYAQCLCSSKLMLPKRQYEMFDKKAIHHEKIAQISWENKENYIVCCFCF